MLIDEILYKRKPNEVSLESKPRIVLPTVLRKKCFTLLHDSVTSAHLGSQKTLGKIKERFYWYGCRKDVEHWCRTCDICASRKPLYRRAKAPMKRYNVGFPLERCALDILGPLPSSNNVSNSAMSPWKAETRTPRQIETLHRREQTNLV